MAYKKYKSDQDKAKAYNHLLAVADKDFDTWSSKAQSWWDKYENLPKRTNVTKKGLLVNSPTGIAVIDSLFSGLTAVDVEFNLEAQARATPEQAMLAETALNQEWHMTHADDERDDAIKDALIAGIGWVKVGYDFFEEVTEVDRDPAEISEEIAELIAEATAAAGHPPTVEDITRLVPTTETISAATRDRICVDYVPWDMVRYDPTARRFKDVRWIAQLTKTPTHEVKQNPLYREYVKRTRGGLARLESLAADSAIDRELLVTGRPMEEDGRVTVIEFWDLESGTLCTFIRGNDWLLHEGVNPHALKHDLQDRSPFVPLVLRKSTRRVRGVSDMDVMMRSLNEKDLYRSRTAEYIRRAVPKVVGPEDILTDEGKAALASDEILAFVSTSRERDPKEIVPLEPPVLPEQVFGMSDRIDNEVREATGVNELMRGLFPDKRQTATSVNEVVSASAARQSEKRNTLQRFHENIATRMLDLMMQFYEQPRMARFVDPSLGNVPWEFTGADIVGDFDIKVSLEPREAPTRETQRQEATVALNVLGPLAQPGADGSSVIDPQRLVAWYMKKYGFSPRDINELLNSQEEQSQQTQDALGVAQAAAAAQQGIQQLPPAQVSPEQGAFGPGSQQVVDELATPAGTGGVGPAAKRTPVV